ncbi:MAG: hypothetical protein D6732_25115 [Methanobacteriota archaeon]|nr:MAG: hypothetical protein D6732_25115 [Euryarchaeota archaeon]
MFFLRMADPPSKMKHRERVFPQLSYDWLWDLPSPCQKASESIEFHFEVSPAECLKFILDFSLVWRN